ncbi:MAG: HNH endonuclease [Thermoplasmata archaeon]
MNREDRHRYVIRQGIAKRFRLRKSRVMNDGFGNVSWRDEFESRYPQIPIDCLNVVIPANSGQRSVARLFLGFREKEHPVEILREAALTLDEGFMLHLCLEVNGRELPVLDLSGKPHNYAELTREQPIVSLGMLISSNVDVLRFSTNVLHFLHLVLSRREKSHLWRKILSRSERNKFRTGRRSEVAHTTHDRDSEIVALLKEYYDHRCQLCGTGIPTPSGKPYVEAHHMVRVCDNGLDVVNNIIIVCPNCHRLLHLWQGFPAPDLTKLS